MSALPRCFSGYQPGVYSRFMQPTTFSALVATLALSAGCERPTQPTPATAHSGGSAGTAAQLPSASAAQGDVPSSALLSPSVLKAVCGATCGGPSSSVNVYRDPQGKIARLYRLYGSCSHSPGIYFSADGEQTELIPEKPIVPGSEEDKALRARHDAQTAGLKLTDVVSCSNGQRSAPK